MVPKWFYVLKASFTTHISSKKSRACLHSCLEETKFVKIGQIGQVVTQTACPQTLLSAQFHFPFKKLGSVNNMEGPGWHYFHSPGLTTLGSENNVTQALPCYFHSPIFLKGKWNYALWNKNSLIVPNYKTKKKAIRCKKPWKRPKIMNERNCSTLIIRSG